MDFPLCTRSGKSWIRNCLHWLSSRNWNCLGMSLSNICAAISRKTTNTMSSPTAWATPSSQGQLPVDFPKVENPVGVLTLFLHKHVKSRKFGSYWWTSYIRQRKWIKLGVTAGAKKHGIYLVFSGLTSWLTSWLTFAGCSFLQCQMCYERHVSGKNPGLGGGNCPRPQCTILPKTLKPLWNREISANDWQND